VTKDRVRRSRRRKINLTRIQGAALTAAFVGIIVMLFGLSRLYVLPFDWTYLQRKTLSQGSQDVLANLEGPVAIKAFVRDNDVSGRQMIEILVGRYQRFKADMGLQFINPDRQPALVRELGIKRPREMIVSYGESSERLSNPTEKTLSNVLLRLARRGEQTVYFLSGHGERSFTGGANYELGEFGKALGEKGFRLRTLSLATDSGLDDMEGLLVVASPSSDLPSEERQYLHAFLRRGGNLLWLLDPDMPVSLESLAERIGLTVLQGTVVDAGSRLYGIDDPAFTVISHYPDHPITRDLASVTLLPRAAGLDVEAIDGWQVTPLLSTQEQSWTETGEVAGRIRYDVGSDERPGPIVVAAALSRLQPESGREQRAAVIGDGDFLSNSFLANGSNLDFGLRLVTWLTAGDARLAIEIRAAPDTRLEISKTQLATLAAWFLLAQPLITLGLGFVVWWRRRRR